MGTHIVAARPMKPVPWALRKPQNHFAEVDRLKPRRPIYRRNCHIPLLLGLFGVIRVPYLKGCSAVLHSLSKT